MDRKQEMPAFDVGDRFRLIHPSGPTLDADAKVDWAAFAKADWATFLSVWRQDAFPVGTKGVVTRKVQGTNAVTGRKLVAIYWVKFDDCPTEVVLNYLEQIAAKAVSLD